MGLTVLCVCSYNRTRSVMMAALLQQHLAPFGVDVQVHSAGTRADGGPPTRETAKLLSDLGIDVRDHVGRPIDQALVAGADLIVTAEQEHVINIAGRWPSSFSSTFTLPELVERTRATGARSGVAIDEWKTALNDGRPAGFAYLDDRSIGEIEDPTGRDRRTWTATFDQINDLTRRMAKAII